ncbi:type IV secretion system DNA-binding domain-containing protein [Lentzea aerocolonigenes]|uniref:type IV secretion system DNA-binding domain-containing protein n=1 Tax=Lentzea aerocolonigenes TaxID=68170 RepID=UPI000B22B30D|nr:type IV secretion system DNA-binding domain-containing protein [Lentzea aerocolonigenes]MCP2245759.1 AAA-like domain-containing protein [Lentzea aerocolonigenes]
MATLPSTPNPCNEPNSHSTSFRWFKLFFPVALDIAAITRLIRPLATRPRVGITGRTPVVTFELWSHGGTLAWLIGLDCRLTHLPEQLRAQLPELILTPLSEPQRPQPLLTKDLRITGVSEPLRSDMASSVTAGLLEVLRLLKDGESAVVQWVIGPAEQRRTPPKHASWSQLLGFANPAQAHPGEQQHWRRKTAEPLFAVRGRVGARTHHLERTRTVLHMLAQAEALASASYSEVKSTAASRRGGSGLINLPAYQRWFGILNATELATLLGWPVDGVTDVGHTTNPAPHQLLIPPTRAVRSPDLRVLGQSVHPADDGQLVSLPVSSALHHLHVTGTTGAGKSTQLASFIKADMYAGRSVLLIEPRGDLVNDVLAHVPPARREDVVLLQPGGQQVVGINPLAGTVEEAERQADEVLQLFRQVFGNSIGPRSSDVLLHALIALARSPQGTLADLPVLLTNSGFRRRILSEVTDPLVLAPFFAWYDGLSSAERAQVIGPVLNKTRTFLSRTAVRRLLGQAAPRFHLEELFTHRRIVLVNLNSGLIGADTASLIGALLLTQLWQAILRRASLPPDERHSVMVVIDEVQDYLKLPVDVGDMLAQARALGVSITAAHQHLGQLTPSLKAAFFANARSRMVFRPSPDDIRPLAGALGSGVSAKLLERLGRFEACCRLTVDNAMSEAFTVRTRPLGPATSSTDELRRISLERYGVDGDDLDQALATRWQGTTSDPEGPIGITRRAA